MTVLARTRITPGNRGLTELQLRIARYIDAYRIAHQGDSPDIGQIAINCGTTHTKASEALARLRQMNAIKGY